MMKTILTAVAVIALTPALASAATDTGGLKQVPANGYARDARIEAFKDRREAAYDAGTQAQMERNRAIKGHAYGDQPNKIPAREKYYRDNRGHIVRDKAGNPVFLDSRGHKHY